MLPIAYNLVPFLDAHHLRERLISIGFYCSPSLHRPISFQRCGTTSPTKDELTEVFIIK
ncbi:MAG TPA: hypothetical protein PLM93_11910 [Sulfuricurvum sp.]|nr:hypothetical protein [Sulfuricurvum sp.]HQT37281.1 hypothetical protein [Sulfuricurvum sp.]